MIPTDDLPATAMLNIKLAILRPWLEDLNEDPVENPSEDPSENPIEGPLQTHSLTN
jgi:hypothetical protein